MQGRWAAEDYQANYQPPSQGGILEWLFTPVIGATRKADNWLNEPMDDALQAGAHTRPLFGST